MAEREKFDFQKYNNEYKKQNYDRIICLSPKGTKEKIQVAADCEGVSISEWIRQAITEKLERN